ncbi:MAG: TolC family protein [Planctomycetes bacterium]|nr:TolC family protein [Planctomycetota bacterium]
MRNRCRSLDDPGLKRFLEQHLPQSLPEWPLRQWNDQTLTLVAIYYHPSLDVARAQWAVARAGVRTAGARPNPAAELAPQYTSNSESGVSPWVTALTLSGTIETAGKRTYRVAQAQHASEAARLSLVAQAWQVRSRLRTSWLDYTAARRRVLVQQEILAAQQRVLKLLEGRLSAGAVAATELITARTALIRAQADVVEAQRQAVENRAAVAEALGVPLRALEGRELKSEVADVSTSVGSDLVSAEMRRRALHERADIRAALADYAASQSALQLEIARQYPDIHLGPGYEYDQGAHKWGLALGLDVPLWHHNQGPVAEAQAKRTEAAARFLALQAQVVAQIDQATAAWTAAQEQTRQIDALREVQRRHVQSIEEMVRVGAADQLDLRSAQLEASETELAYVDAIIRRQQALGQLEDAVQIPFAGLTAVEQNPRSQTVKENHS